MAEAITYADLRFVKAPLKKSNSSRLGQDPGADEDGELTYENVQVPPVPGVPLSLASSGLGDKAAVKSEQPTASWSAVTSPAVRRILPYLQVSQQLQQMNRVLEATNSSLRQQLHLKITQLEQRAEDLQGSRRDLVQSQEALQVEQRARQEAEGQLQACQADKEKTKENLRSEEEQRRALEQKLSNMENRLKSIFTCHSSDTCCPMGWIMHQKSCFYKSLTRKNWEDSQRHCEALSSKLATFSGIYPQRYYLSLSMLLPNGDSQNSYWIGLSSKDGKLVDDTQHSRVYIQNSKCPLVKIWPSSYTQLFQEACTTSLPSICEMPAFRFPDWDSPLHRADTHAN
ncbi:B-cell differentiation antigen CD72 isoform X2 [Sapajus apella]|uniref:B-cell differentiation antigen CD72 isoform X2 n=1 Tax=Sapajus apella TaxID=9515 RepID=A0A6J3ET32_SAPAP|nr:B-cell differentiation antigen CD72 isoform X2 [Sapajus apella]